MIFGHAIHSMAVTTMIAVAWLPQNTTVGWQQRLGTMDPGDPMAYFDLPQAMPVRAAVSSSRVKLRILASTSASN